jgi:prolyl 4-hydroxylase
MLMTLSQPHLNRATVHNKNTGKLENADYRVSKTAWLDNDLPEDTEGIVRKVNRRIEDASELSHDYAELQQINNYGMGGQYEPHYDMVTNHDTKIQGRQFSQDGNRIATLLLYLREPSAGGATIFVDSGARLRSIKNAAAFWYNLLPNGEPDLITRHAGCPVLAGTKWVMNKWFHANDQIFTRPCDLEQFKREKDTKLYNGKYTV